MSTQVKTLIVALACIISISGIFILSKSRGLENVSNFGVSSSSQIVSSQSMSSSFNSIVLSSSSQSQTVSSDVVKVVEAPKSDITPIVKPKPKIETPQLVKEPIVEAPKPIQKVRNYELNYQLNEIGDLSLSQFDIAYIKENIKDVADYYYDSVKLLYPNKYLYIGSFAIQKIDDFNLIIQLSTALEPSSEGNTELRDIKNYRLIRFNDHDGEFEEVLNYYFPQFTPNETSQDTLLKQPSTSLITMPKDFVPGHD